MKLSVRLVNLGRLIKRLSHFFDKTPEQFITAHMINEHDLKYMRQLERITPHNNDFCKRMQDIRGMDIDDKIFAYRRIYYIHVDTL